mgnify:CR=1 FL=1
MNIVVREARLDEAQLIAELTRAAWQNKVAASSSGHHESLERVLSDLRAGGGFVLLLDHMAVGSLRWMPLETDTEVWEILRMGIIPNYRGRGLSQHLLEAVIHHAQECAVSQLRLAVRADQDKLIDFYAAFGFELAPEIEYSHANPAEPLPNVMRKFLL